VAQLHPGAIVIGSDQVPDLDGQPWASPAHHERATEQLRQMSGQTVNFHTASGRGLPGHRLRAQRWPRWGALSRTDDAEIERYLRAEQPYDCAGSAKSEGLGIACWTPSSATTPRR
jgi:septum formation protein